MMLFRIVVSVLVVLFAIPVFGQQIPDAKPKYIGVSYFQESEDEKPKEKLELQEEFEKLERRLRELEDDYESHADASKEDAESSQKTNEEVGETLDGLKEHVESLTESVDDLEDTLPSIAFHGHKNPKLEIFGRVHLDYWSFPDVDPGIDALEGGDPQDRVVFRRLRIGVKGDLNDNMFYKYEGEFAGGVASSYRDAYLGFKNLPRLRTVIIGNHKRPYGLDHLNSSRYNVFLERPFVIEANNQDSRRLGVSTNGFSEDLKFNWRSGIWNQRLTQNGFGYIGDHYQPELASRLASTPWYDECSGGRGYFHWGLSGSVRWPDGRGGILNASRYDTRPEARSTMDWINTDRIAGANTSYLNGVESVFNYGPFQFVGEYQRVDVDRLDAFGEDLTFHGGYFYVSYFLTGEHMPWNRERGTLARVKPFENFFKVRDCEGNIQRGKGAWQIAARYSYADYNDLDIVGGEASSFTLGLNWYWNPYARMQFNYIVGDIDREPVGSGDYQIFGLRFMVDF